MKRTSLTTAVIAGIVGVAGISNMASAVYLNNDGLGQVLIYPYYTINKGNSTILTVVNTTQAGKAIKVRFLEAYNSREVLDFNLYMSAQDVWTAQVVPDTATGGAGVFSTDNSCTVPKLSNSSAAPTAFRTYAFSGSASDTGPTDYSRTLEGYVELIEMGVVTNATKNSYNAIKHSAGIPANCAQVVGAWNGGYWATGGNAAANIDISEPTGGLFGSGTIINVDNGTIFGYNADAVDQFWVDAIPQGHHTGPGSLSPNISQGTSHTSYVFTPGPVGTTPVLATTTYSAPVNAVSSIFMADQIYNEYWTGGGTAANSEWVVTFPTKRFYVDPGTTGSVYASDPFDESFGGLYFNGSDQLVVSDPGESCAPIAISYTGREEEQPPPPGIGFSPPPPGQPGVNLCFEAQVVSFNQTITQNATNNGGGPSAILGSNLTNNIATGLNNGWAQINFFDYTVSPSSQDHELPAGYVTGGDNVFFGLPVTGFWVFQGINGAMGGVLANYTSLYKHRSHRYCSLGGSEETNCS